MASLRAISAEYKSVHLKKQSDKNYSFAEQYLLLCFFITRSVIAFALTKLDAVRTSRCLLFALLAELTWRTLLQKPCVMLSDASLKRVPLELVQEGCV